VTVPADSKVSDIKNAINAQSIQIFNLEHIPIIQQELSYKPKTEGEAKVVLNDDHMPIKMLTGDVLVVKNLGNQMAWKIVFYI
jgi:hypothetical protein